jgi:hypothetical protein
VKSRLALALFSGALTLGGVACGATSSSQAACAEWKTSYRSEYVPGYGTTEKELVEDPASRSRVSRVPTGQTCVRWSNGSSATPTTRRATTTTTSQADNAVIQAACRAEEEAYGRSVDADETQYTHQAWMACLKRS